MTLLLTQTFDGLASGAIYASLALSIVLVYKSTGLVNFSQGEMAMLCTYITWQGIALGLPLWLAVLATIPFAFLLGVTVERYVVRPFERQSPLAVMAVTLGLFLLINNAVGWIWDFEIKSFPGLFPDSTAFRVLGARVEWSTIGNLAVLAAVGGVLYLLLHGTRIGLAMRGVADNRDSATLVGVRVSHTLMVGWGVGSVIGAVSGVLVAPGLFLHPAMMFNVLIYAFIAAILGGLDSFSGAIVGGLAVGVTENLVGTYVPGVGADMKFGVSLSIIILVLLVRPTGLFGTARVVRV